MADLEGGFAALAAERAALDVRERKLVVACRALGWTWSQIGAQLGLTRQGAMKRHADVAAEDRASKGGDG